MSSSWTNDDLIAIEDAIKKGILEVEYNDRRVKYRSLNDLFRIRHEIKVCLGLIKRSGRFFAKTDKGLGC